MTLANEASCGKKPRYGARKGEEQIGYEVRRKYMFELNAEGLVVWQVLLIDQRHFRVGFHTLLTGRMCWCWPM